MKKIIVTAVLAITVLSAGVLAYGLPSCGTCVPVWECGGWSECTPNHQSRTCTDLNSCGTNIGKPSEWQFCEVCTPNKICSSWGACEDGLQSRGCSDGCGTVNTETQSCTIDDGGGDDGCEEVIINNRVQNTDGWVPNMGDPVNTCRMNTYVSKYCKTASFVGNKCILQKRLFSICWWNTPSTYQEEWINQYVGNYVIQKEWITPVGKYKFTWWILSP